MSINLKHTKLRKLCIWSNFFLWILYFGCGEKADHKTTDLPAQETAGDKISVPNTKMDNSRLDSQNAKSPEMIKIDAGSFMMGQCLPKGCNEKKAAKQPKSACAQLVKNCAAGRDEFPHKVTLTRAFYLSKHEVTQAQYQALMGKNPSGWKGKNNPVENITWFDAIAYANAMSQKDGLPACYTYDASGKHGCTSTSCGQVVGVGSIYECKGYRLPTEAEWEFAARANSDGPIYGPVDEIAWYRKNASYNHHPVGQKKPNEFGLYDMHGNVSEYCHDIYAPYKKGQIQDPSGPKKPATPVEASRWKVKRPGGRINKGGSYTASVERMRVSKRDTLGARVKTPNHGFRLARTAH